MSHAQQNNNCDLCPDLLDVVTLTALVHQLSPTARRRGNRITTGGFHWKKWSADHHAPFHEVVHLYANEVKVDDLPCDLIEL